MDKTLLNHGDVFPSMMTVPDCIVVQKNKIGGGHGEAKLYIASKDAMREFYGGKGFVARCFLLKSDLVAYMMAIKNEYFEPSQSYYGKDDLPQLWTERMQKIQNLDDVIYFDIADQTQIEGPRGYVNSDDFGYKIIREIALPLVSYIYAERIMVEGEFRFYWRLFVDFDAIWERKNGPLVFTYGKKKNELGEGLITEVTATDVEEARKSLRTVREGQQKYREKLLEQCPYCPFTMISDERLLIASHIKPWVASSDEEKIDPDNGFILSPLYDKLFDKGFITFTKTRHVVISNYIAPFQWKKIGLKGGEFLQGLPMNEKRIEYLEFHHEAVFKGVYSEQ